jgi:hypothetical protein
MERAAVSPSTPAAVAFTDGLGERHQILEPTGNDKLEVLCLREELAAVPSFEFALRERVSRLAGFRHASFGRVRSVERMTDRYATLAVVSESTTGIRLSDLLARAAERRVNLDINAALSLLRQLVPALVAFHEYAREIPGLADGALGPERVIVTSDARLVVVEYTMGAALEQLRFSQERYWHELRVAVPRTAGLPRFDQRIDVTQVGIVALSLILGRLLRDDEYPARVGDVVASTWAISAKGGFEPLPPGLRGWLGRALQLDARTAFSSAAEARAELDKVLGDSDLVVPAGSLEAFLAKYHAADRPIPAPEIQPEPKASPPPAAVVMPPTPPPVPLVRPAPVATHTPVARAEPPYAPVARAEPPYTPVVRAEPPYTPVVRTEPPYTPPAPASTHVPRPPKTVGDDLFHGFGEYHEPAIFGAAEEKSSRSSMKIVTAAAILIAVAAGGYFVGRPYFGNSPAAAATTGTLVVTSNPAGVQAFVDGEPHGVTPLTVSLSAGSHVVELRGGGAPRSIPVTITAGVQASQYIELQKDGPSAGQLQIRTEPAGARVIVDGIARGTSPITVADLEPGEHTVGLESDAGSVKQTVSVESGVTASLVVPLTAPPQSGPVSGWIAVSVPMEVQIFENGQLLGTSRTDRIMVSAGRHDVDFVNDALGFRLTRTLQVPAGKTASVNLEAPRGSIALNAQPWAEVWIDGERIGETPIGNHQLTIGSHDVVFRNPELGEQHHTAIVTLKGPTRLSVDLRKK